MTTLQTPHMVEMPAKRLAGKRLKMSFIKNRTLELWQSFMPQRNQISGRISEEFYSVEVYPASFFNHFDPEALFEKWAAVEIDAGSKIPDGMEILEMPAGLYAVFVHKGPASQGAAMYDYIFTQWLPKSEFVIDSRPHFALMGEKYSNDSPDSEEEIWIPVKPKH